MSTAFSERRLFEVTFSFLFKNKEKKGLYLGQVSLHKERGKKGIWTICLETEPLTDTFDAAMAAVIKAKALSWRRDFPTYQSAREHFRNTIDEVLLNPIQVQYSGKDKKQ
jgi:hypothetical protein